MLHEDHMPLLAALDECVSMLTKISIYAELGLEEPHLHPYALLSIRQCCVQVDETLCGIFGMVEQD